MSLMRQYTPTLHCRVPGLERVVSDREYKRAMDAVHAYGLTGYLQGEQAADSSFTPPFDGTGLELSN